jgi:hypothetical protein
MEEQTDNRNRPIPSREPWYASFEPLVVKEWHFAKTAAHPPPSER